MRTYSDRNFTSGTEGLIAIDKIGNKVLFLDPTTYDVTRSLDGFASRLHELLISEDHTKAFIPIYGDGIHGDNPHPGHLIAGTSALHRTRLPTLCGGALKGVYTASARTAVSFWR
jgi:hypothetical protein